MRVNSKTKAKNIIDTRKRSSRFPYKVTYQIRFLTDTLQETDSSVQGTASSASRFTRLATLSLLPHRSLNPRKEATRIVNNSHSWRVKPNALTRRSKILTCDDEAK